MPSIDYNLPNNVKPFSATEDLNDDRVLSFPELEFPRKLENCDVVIWCGSDCKGKHSTKDGDIWLLAPNVIKMVLNYVNCVYYGVVIKIKYHSSPKEE